MKFNIFLALFAAAMLLSGCLDENITGNQTAPEHEPELVSIFNHSYIVVNPDSGAVEAGTDTFQFKTVYHKVTVEGDSSAVITRVLPMQDLNIIPDSSHYTWLNEDSADSKIALIQVRGQVGEQIRIPVMHLFDDSARTDTVKLTVVAPGTKPNCAPTVSFVASPLQGFVPLITTVTPEFFDPDGDSLTAWIETPFDTVAVQDNVPVDLTFTEPGTHVIRLVVDDGKLNGRVEVEQAIFAQELPPTRLLVKSSTIDSVSVLLTGQGYSAQLITDTLVVLPDGGTYQLIAGKEGFLTDTLQVEVGGNQNNVVDIHLRRPGQPDSTFLAISSDPVDVVVRVVDLHGTIDSTVITPKVIALPYGDVALKLYASKTGYTSDTLDVYVVEDQTNNVQVTLSPVVTPDPPTVYFSAVPDTAIQFQQYRVEWQTSNVRSATHNGEPVSPNGNTLFIPNHLGPQEHVFVAIGDDGSVVTVRDTVVIITPPLNPWVDFSVQPNVVNEGGLVNFLWTGNDIQNGSASISIDGQMIFTNLGASGNLVWQANLAAGNYQVIWSGLGLNGQAILDTADLVVNQVQPNTYHVRYLSAPNGAEVYDNGAWMGNTDTGWQEMFALGQHNVSFRLSGFLDKDTSYVAQAGDSITLAVTLEPDTSGGGGCSGDVKVFNNISIELQEETRILCELDAWFWNDYSTFVFEAQNESSNSSAMRFFVEIISWETGDTLIRAWYSFENLLPREEVFCVLPGIPGSQYRTVMRAYNAGGDPISDYGDIHLKDGWALCNNSGNGPTAKSGGRRMVYPQQIKKNL